MLLFRSEEHVQRWCEQWGIAPGAMLSLEQAWRLAQAWFEADRGALGWARPPLERVEGIFASIGLVAPFWTLRA